MAECHPEHLLSESKFLLTESLQELVKFLIQGTSLDPGSPGEVQERPDHGALFYLELLTRITLANRDRVSAVWRGVVDHLHRSALLPRLGDMSVTVQDDLRLCPNPRRRDTVPAGEIGHLPAEAWGGPDLLLSYQCSLSSPRSAWLGRRS